MALSGQGADELFGGYRKHRVASLAEHWSRVPGPVRSAAGGGAPPRPGPRRQAARRARGAAIPWRACSASSGLRAPGPAGELFGGALAEQADAAERVVRGTSPARRVPRRSRPRCTSTRSSASSTTCSPTSTGRRWRARSRSACRSSTTSSSSCAPRIPTEPRCAGSRASTSCGAPPRASSRTSCSTSEARLLQRGGRHMARRGRRDRRAGCCSRRPRLRARSLDRDVVARVVTRVARRATAAATPAAALADHARAVAGRVPAARLRGRPRPERAAA